jgi:hypothetical protein
VALDPNEEHHLKGEKGPFCWDCYNASPMQNKLDVAVSDLAAARERIAELEANSEALSLAWLSRGTQIDKLRAERDRLAAEVGRLRENAGNIQRELIYLYWSAYMAGHHDTVEGCYTHVQPSERWDYHAESVTECLHGGDMPILEDVIFGGSAPAAPSGEVERLREALENPPYDDYYDALREGCDHEAAWGCFKEAYAEHARAALTPAPDTKGEGEADNAQH